MMSQTTEVVPPLKTDDGLKDYTGIIQGNLQDLFKAAHTHPVSAAAPANNEGNVGDLTVRTISGTSYLYAKVSKDSWKRVALS